MTLELVAAPLAGDAAPRIRPSDVIVLTGGARGVTAEVAVALAEAYRPTLVLLGRSPAPAAEPPSWPPAATRPRSSGRWPRRLNARATPRQIGEQCRRSWPAARSGATLDRIAAAGAQARSITRSTSAMPRRWPPSLAEVRRTFGPIRGIVHGAGVLADRTDRRSDRRAIRRVYATKVAGLQAVLAATATDPLKLLALFSSSTGRFGRAGQVAYAAANEAVNKFAQAEARRRPDCRVVAVNWGPWDGGMVTPALRGVFAAEGIGLIPLAAGARHLLAEFAAT